MTTAGAPRHASSPDWLAFLERAPGASVYQCEEWGGLLALSGWKTRLVCRRRGGRIVSGCLLATKRIPTLRHAVAVAPRGIVLSADWEEGDLSDLLGEIRESARSEGAIFVQLGACVPRARDNTPVEEGVRLQESLRRLGCRHRPRAEWSTFWLELQIDSEAMLARMSVNARRDIRLALRHDVEVFEANEKEDVDLFYQMHAELYRSKGITVTPEITFAHGVRALVESRRASIFWARAGGRRDGAAVVSLCGIPRFMWGARDMSPYGKSSAPTGHLLHFRIMEAMRERGKAFYDLGGSPAYDLAPEHPNYGVWRFKKSMGGTHVDFVEEMRLILSPGLTAVHDRLLPLYRKVFVVSPFLKGRGDAGAGL